jgi:hypothetical protein
MKTVVLDHDVVEVEVKPHAMLDEYRVLLAGDVGGSLAIAEKLIGCVCPGCRSRENRPAFAKYGLVYLECTGCGSVYVSPRPSEGALVDFYRNSRAAQFWREKILPETQDVRRTKLFRPRAQWLLDVVDEYHPKPESGIAVGYHNALLIEELQEQESQLFPIVVTNPVADIEFEGLKLPGVEVHPMPIGELAGLGPVDIFMAFDILDRCSDLEMLFSVARDALAPGGILLGTTILISGFDLQVLWDRSESIYPPERMNLLSAEGLTSLCARHGFEVLEFSTPGMFDVEVVQHAIKENPEEGWPRFIQYLVEKRDEGALSALQEFLQRFRLSSYARIVLRQT